MVPVQLTVAPELPTVYAMPSIIVRSKYHLMAEVQMILMKPITLHRQVLLTR